MSTSNDPLAALEVMRREAHMSRQRAMVSAGEIAEALASDRATIDAITALVAAARPFLRPETPSMVDMETLRAALANFPESKA